MATKFQIKRSSVSGVAPTVGDIAPGELAVNLADKKLYTANSTAVFELGTNLTFLSVAGNLTVAGLVANGNLGINGQVLTSNGTVVYWSDVSTTSGSYSAVITQQFTANGTANSFTISGGYIPNAIEVYVNGVKQLPNSEVIVSSGSTINFVTPPGNNYIVDVFGYKSVNGVILIADNLTSNLTFTNSAVIIANGSFGTNNQVLTSNGSGMYWSTVLSDAVTSITTGSGLTGGIITNTGTISVLANTGIVANSTGLFVNSSYINTLDSNTATYLSNSSGTLSNITSWIAGNSATAYSNAVSYVDGKLLANTSQLDANIALVQSQITANVATAYSNAVSYVDNKLYANTGQLNANIALVQSQITANSATAYSNAVSYVDGKLYVNTSILDANVSTLQAQITANAATAYSNAVSYVDSKLYANTDQLNANIALVQSQITANSDTAYSNAVPYVDNKQYANTLQLSANAATAYSNAILYSSNADNLTSGTVAEPRLPFRMDQSIRTTDAVQFSSLTVTGNVVVNGIFTVVSGNTVAFTDNMLFINQGILADISNISGNGTVITFTANNNYQTGWDVLIANVNPSSYNGTYHNITFANSTIFRVSNTNSDAYVSGGTARGQSESNPDLGIAAGYNDGTYHHTGIFRDHSSGVWKVFDNYLPEPDTSIYIDQANASFRIANFQANTIYIGQNDSYGTINSTSYSGTSNNSTNLGGLSLATIQGQISGNAATAYANAVINTAAQFTWTNTHTFAALVLGNTTVNTAYGVSTITINGVFGTNGQILSSNGTSIYWANASGGFTNGQSISVNNFVINGSFTSNGTSGNTGQYLTSNGTSTYWAPSNRDTAGRTLLVKYSNGAIAWGDA